MTALDIILEAMATRAMTKTELAALAGVKHQRICAIMKDLPQPVFIESWENKGKGPFAPRFRIGTEPDAPRPMKLSNAERSKRYRATPNGYIINKECSRRWYKSEAGKAYNSAKGKSWYLRKKFEKHGLAAIDPLMAAIMGVSNASR